MIRTFRILLGLGLLTVIGLAGWWSLPKLLGQLPNVVQQRLPHEVLVLMRTPLPTALPAPEISVQTTAVIRIPTQAIIETSTPIPTPTRKAGDTPVIALSQTPLATPLPTYTPIPAQIELAGLVIDPQGFNNCGPANLSIVLGYYGHTDDQDIIAEALRPAYEDRNVSPTELANYIDHQTSLKALLLWGSNLTELKKLIAAGFPVIIEEGLLPSEWEGWMGHYLTLYGYDDTGQSFMGMDTYLGPWDSSGRTIEYANLDEMWAHFNHVALIVYPKERELELADIIGQERLEPVGMWQHVVDQAQTTIATDPENAFAWFNLGGGLTHLGELTGDQVYYEGATTAFDQSRTLGLPWRMLWYQFEPYIAYLENGRYEDVLTLANATIHSGGQFMEESFLYRGHAMRALGKEAQAQADYARVVEINPEGAPAAEAATFLE